MQTSAEERKSVFSQQQTGEWEGGGHDYFLGRPQASSLVGVNHKCWHSEMMEGKMWRRFRKCFFICIRIKPGFIFFNQANQIFQKLLIIFKRELDCHFYSIFNLWTMRCTVTCSFEVTASDPLTHWIPRGEG